MSDPNNHEAIHTVVRDRYGAVARTGDTSLEGCDASSCCVPDALYPVEMLAELPSGATEISLGCGNPIDAAGLQPGESVLDLGSGGGIDCFFAAQRVGPAGRVIGVDMTPDMLAKAQANLEKLRVTAANLRDYANVEFRFGMIEALPVEDASVDVIISNCVINLAPDKMPVFREMFRVLKPGGRVHVSDMVTRGPMLQRVQEAEGSWVACLAGALPVEEFQSGLETVGFENVRVRPAGQLSSVLSHLPLGVPFSATITARKPDSVNSD